MPMPLKLLNRLRLGRDVEAEVTASRPENIAWVYIYPLLDPDRGRRVVIPGHEGKIVAECEGTPISGYFLRFLEIERSVARDYHEMRRDEIGKPHSDIRLTADSEEELEHLLSNWLIDFSTLHVPSDAGYWFERGPELVE